MATKKELAEIAIHLFDNIDQADQFDVYPLFYHCAKAFLLSLIQDMVETIEHNNGRFVLDGEKIDDYMAEAYKVLHRNPPENQAQ